MLVYINYVILADNANAVTSQVWCDFARTIGLHYNTIMTICMKGIIDIKIRTVTCTLAILLAKC